MDFFQISARKLLIAIPHWVISGVPTKHSNEITVP
jgi:hypothetical protein